MRVIFLDIDGVLNSEKYAIRYHKEHLQDQGRHIWIDPDAVALVKKICDTCNAKIILDSSWRLYDLKNTLNNLQEYIDIRPLIPYIIGITPRLDRERGREIIWTLTHWEKEIEESRISEGYDKPEPGSYVIIDDDNDMLYAQRYNFIHTDYQVGLTEEQAEQAIEILKDFRSYLHKKSTEEFIEWMKKQPKFTTPESVPDIPNVGKELVDKYVVPVLIEHGAIPKDKLVIGKTYVGSCRNASKAVWNGEHFVYERYKWGSRYNESINHFQDDDGYDVFVPIQECDD